MINYYYIVEILVVWVVFVLFVQEVVSNIHIKCTIHKWTRLSGHYVQLRTQKGADSNQNPFIICSISVSLPEYFERRVKPRLDGGVGIVRYTGWVTETALLVPIVDITSEYVAHTCRIFFVKTIEKVIRLCTVLIFWMVVLKIWAFFTYFIYLSVMGRYNNQNLVEIREKCPYIQSYH